MADRPDAARIRFTAGFPPDMTDPDSPDYLANFPADLKQALRLLVGSYVENKESMILPSNRADFLEMPDGVLALIAPYILPRM